jgi:hypothetical protein
MIVANLLQRSNFGMDNGTVQLHLIDAITDILQRSHHAYTVCRRKQGPFFSEIYYDNPIITKAVFRNNVKSV